MKTLLQCLAFAVVALPLLVAAHAAEMPKAPVPPGFALVPTGEFTMGDALDQDKEAPPHKVNVSAFYMQKTEVTKAQWDEVRAWGLKHGYTDLPKGYGKAADHPVQTVSWDAAVKWCNARSEKEGLTPCYYTGPTRTTVYRKGVKDLTNTRVKWNTTGYRLPTEAEWEKAARGGLSGKRFPWGNSISHREANFHNIGKESYQTGSESYHPTFKKGIEIYTSPVGSFSANGYGLYDMAGNVVEWCWDCYGPYPAESEMNPKGPVKGSVRVYRGGVWDGWAEQCRVAKRSNCSPGCSSVSGGFRVARSSIP